MASKFHQNLILTGYIDYYCLVCESYIRSEEDADIHIEKQTHKKNLGFAGYFEKCKDDHIWKVKKGYFCEFCNKFLTTAAKVELHVAEHKHNDNKGNQLLKRVGNSIIMSEYTIIDEKAWNGIIGETCVLCNIEFNNENIHKTNQMHIINLILKNVEFITESDFYRRVDNSSFQCLICNRIFLLDTLNNHLKEEDHLKNYEACSKFTLSTFSENYTEETGLNPRISEKYFTKNQDLNADLKPDSETKYVYEAKYIKTEKPNVVIQCTTENSEINRTECDDESSETKNKIAGNSNSTNSNSECDNRKSSCEHDGSNYETEFNPLMKDAFAVVSETKRKLNKEEGPEKNKCKDNNRMFEKRKCLEVDQHKSKPTDQMEAKFTIAFNKNHSKTDKNVNNYVVKTENNLDKALVSYVAHVNASNADNQMTNETNTKTPGTSKSQAIKVEVELTIGVNKNHSKTDKNLINYVGKTENNLDKALVSYVAHVNASNADNHMTNETNTKIPETYKSQALKVEAEFTIGVNENHSETEKNSKNDVVKTENNLDKDLVNYVAPVNASNTDNQMTNETFIKIPGTSKSPAFKVEEPSDPLSYAKANHMTYNKAFSNAYCRICNVRVPANLRNMKEHVNGYLHKSKAVKVVSEKQVIPKKPLKKFITSYSTVTNIYNDDVIVNEKFCLTKMSFFMITEIGPMLRCQACEVTLTEYDVDHHLKTCCHEQAMAMTPVVWKLHNEFVREVRPGLFHCGFCNLMVGPWEDVASHLQCTDHKKYKEDAVNRLEQRPPGTLEYRQFLYMAMWGWRIHMASYQFNGF